MLQRTSTNNREVLLGVDQRLARRRITLERPNTKLATRDRQLERASRRRPESKGDDRRQRRDLRAGDTVSTGFIVKGLDVGGDLGVDGLGVFLWED